MAVKKKENTLDPKDFNMLKQYVEAINKITMEIGSIEIQKNASIANQVALNAEFKTFSEGVQFKYGKISIDIQNGTYKTEEEIEAEENEPDGPNKEN